MDFQIHALEREPFAPLFQCTDAELKARNALRTTVQAKPGTPCRVSMQDANIGESVILINHTHQDAPTPYKASHAIFVRENAEQAHPAINQVPEVLHSRLISIRLFDRDHLMIDADVVQGTHLHMALSTAFDDKQVAYIHLHYAKPGCFAAKVTRAS